MIETTRTLAKKFWRISLQACLIGIFLSFVGVPAVFATTMPHAGGSPNVPPTNYCLHGAAAITEIGSNEIRIMGGTANYCGNAYTLTYVNQRMALTNGCEGTHSIGTDIIYDNFALHLGESGSATYDYDEGCISCEYVDGKLVGWTYPNFTVTLTVTATGYYKLGSTNYPVASHPITASYYITNTGANAPECPRTD